MGQAKQRGTFEQRLSMALERAQSEQKQANLALTKQINRPHVNVGRKPSPLLVAQLAMLSMGFKP